MISSVSDVPHRMSKYLSDLAENIAQPNRYANPLIFIVPSADVSAVVPPPVNAAYGEPIPLLGRPVVICGRIRRSGTFPQPHRHT